MPHVRALVDAALPAPGPLRRLGWGSLTTNVGNSAWYTTWAIYLTREVGLSPATVGLGMTIASGVAVALATPVGRLADRVGPREVFAALQLVQALGAAGFLLVHDAWSFTAVACVATTGSAAGGARTALVAGLAEGAERLRALASLRMIGHVGWVLGASLGAVVLAVGTRAAFAGLVAFDAATYLAYALVARSVPHVAGREGPRPRSASVLRDRPFVALAALMGALSLCWGMLSAGVPLWIAHHTHASTAWGAVIVLVNSAAIAALQLRASRGVATPGQAARRGVVSALALAASCLVFASTAGLGGWAAVVLLLAGGLLHVTGELLFVAASWGLSLGLMRDGAPGEYQGLFAAGEAGAQMAAPILMTTLVAGWGRPGWLTLAALFAGVAAAVPAATRWALVTRPGAQRWSPTRAGARSGGC